MCVYLAQRIFNAQGFEQQKPHPPLSLGRNSETNANAEDLNANAEGLNANAEDT